MEASSASRSADDQAQASPEIDPGYAMMEVATAAIHRMLQEQGLVVAPNVAGDGGIPPATDAPIADLTASSRQATHLSGAGAGATGAPATVAPGGAALTGFAAPATGTAPAPEAAARTQSVQSAAETLRAAPLPAAPRAASRAESMPVAKATRTPAPAQSPTAAPAPHLASPPAAPAIRRKVDTGVVHAESVEVVQRASDDTDAMNDAPAGMSLEEIARQVYPLIKDLLRHERDRFGG
jgi:hypothetical protein